MRPRGGFRLFEADLGDVGAHHVASDMQMLPGIACNMAGTCRSRCGNRQEEQYEYSSGSQGMALPATGKEKMHILCRSSASIEGFAVGAYECVEYRWLAPEWCR